MVCARVELAVGEDFVVVFERGRVGGVGGLRGEQFGDGALRDGRGGVVPLVHDLVSFGRIDDLDPIDPSVRISGDNPQERRELSCETGQIPVGV
jgi:hypothetical protein